MRLAKNAGIDLCTVHDAQSPTWPLSIAIPLLWLERHAELEVQFLLHGSAAVKTDLAFSRDARDWIFSVDGGTSRFLIFDAFARYWKEDPRNSEPGGVREWRPGYGDLSLRVAPDVWLKVDELCVRYQPIVRGWRGSVRLSDCRGLMNQSTDTLQARAVLSSSEIPVSRDPSWPAVDDPDAFRRGALALLVVECPDISADSLQFRKFSTGAAGPISVRWDEGVDE